MKCLLNISRQKQIILRRHFPGLFPLPKKVLLAFGCLFLVMAIQNQFDIEIDKLTRSIENAVSGDVFKTNLVAVATKDIKSLTTSDWLFN